MKKKKTGAIEVKHTMKSIGTFNGFYVGNDRGGEEARARVNGTIRTESELSAKERSTTRGSLTFLNPEVSECTYILNGSCHKKPVGHG